MPPDNATSTPSNVPHTDHDSHASSHTPGATTDSPTKARAPETAQSGLIYLARAGYAARGVVYLIVGGLAVAAAVGSGGKTAGSKGALASLLDEPFGQVLLFIIGVGLLGYALWRFCQAYWDADGHGRDTKGMVIRIGLLVSAVTHTVLAAWVFTAIFGGGGGGGGGASSSGGGGGGKTAWGAWLLDKPGGRFWVGLIGALILGAGVAQFVKGYKADFEKNLAIDYDKWPWARSVCRFGLIVRGVVFFIFAWFFFQAAIESQAGQTKGLGGVLQWLGSQPWGWIILAVVALGLIAFGIYGLIEAVYRQINPPDRLEATPS